MRTCYACGSSTTGMNKGKYPTWYMNRGIDLVLCRTCNKKLIQYSKDMLMGHHKRRITFRGKRVFLEADPRTGVCSNCGEKVGDKINRTSMHHIVYDILNPIAHTLELCNSCHSKTHESLGQHPRRNGRYVPAV